MRAVWLSVLLGCAGATRHDMVVEHRDGVPDILDGWRSDFDHPFTPSGEIMRKLRRHIRQCDAGDRAACWLAWPEATPQIAANCRAGHHLSCRALRLMEGPDLPGATGRARSRECSVGSLDKCDMPGLWRECVEGFPRSCDVVRERFVDLHVPFVPVMLTQRLRDLSEPGCRQGLVNECAYVDEKLSAEMRCRHDVSCTTLARLAKRNGDLRRAALIYEYGCQRGEIFTCQELGGFYYYNPSVEPIENRGWRLADWACKRVDELDGGKPRVYNYDRCIAEVIDDPP
jgi:hypothetical protein